MFFHVSRNCYAIHGHGYKTMSLWYRDHAFSTSYPISGIAQLLIQLYPLQSLQKDPFIQEVRPF